MKEAVALGLRMAADRHGRQLETLPQDGFTAELFTEPGPGWERCERELADAGVPLPLPHRAAWARANASSRVWFLAARDGSGKCSCGFALDVIRSRILPGFLLVRVERLGPARTPEARQAALAALAQLAWRRRRILRVHLEVFSRDAAVQDDIAHTAPKLGFRPSSDRRRYTQTVVLELGPSENELFAALPGQARRNIKEPAKRSLEVRPIIETAYARRMGSLVQETMRRTGGVTRPLNWPALIQFSRDHPMLSRIVGTFRADETAPEALLAFAWGRSHADSVEYGVAASTRMHRPQVSLAYALAWDLICWARRSGARWFDFGGVTTGHAGDSEDPLGGISDFKRSFSQRVETVGDEWTLEPRPFPAKVARVLSGMVRRVSGRARGSSLP